MSNEAQKVLSNLRVYKTYLLKYPISTPSGETITEISIRRMTLADREQIENQGFDYEKQGVKAAKFVLLRLSNLVPEDLEQLDNEDFVALEGFAVELIKGGKSEKSQS